LKKELTGKEVASEHRHGGPVSQVAFVKKLVFLILLIAACFIGAAYLVNRRHESPADADRYTLLPAEFGRAAEVVSATGLVQAREVFPVGTELAGKVTEVLADFNQVVREGDVLLRLDDRVARQKLKQAEIAIDLADVSVKQAEANRDTAAKALQRVWELSPEVRRQTDVDVAESHLRAAEVGIEAARVRVKEAEEARRQAELGLKLHTVRAPVLGPDPSAGSASLPVTGLGSLAADSSPTEGRRSFTVLDRHVSLNQEVGPPASAQLFTLAGSMDRMQVQAQVVEGDVNKIRRGMAADFTVPGDGGDVAYKGSVEEIRLVPTSEHGAVFYTVIVDVRNSRNSASGDWRLRPGLTASVDFIRRVHERVWKVPGAALSFQPDPTSLSDEARSRLAELPDANWRAVWVVGADERPWPVFVRIGGVNSAGEAGVQDAQSSEVLEWDPVFRSHLDSKDVSTFPRLIIAAPAAKKSGFFSAPNIKF
jgi:HlyD family secretion protein